MPLVYGVCRTASAPTLSHGGSRLNASKPEANPKTRYPTSHNKHSQHNPSSAVVCSNVGKSLLVLTVDTKPFVFPSGSGKTRHSPRSHQRPCYFRGILKKGFSIESPLKPLLPAQPRWRQVSHIITRHLPISLHEARRNSSFRAQAATTSAKVISTQQLDLHSKAAKATKQPFPNINVPLQTREHALAGISGMLRSSTEAQGAFTSRGAKPYGLNLML